MARILKIGYMSIPEYDLVCKHCGTLARYQKHELSFFEGMDDEELVSFECPHCEKETTILANRLPEPSSEKEIGEIKKERHNILTENLKKITGWWGG